MTSAQEKRYRYALGNRSEDWGAELRIDGVTVEKDWRYDAFVDFLSYSPSYQMTCLYHNGQREYEELPADRDQLIQVIKDFGDYFSVTDGGWWDRTGKYLFGIRAPIPKVEVKGVLSSQCTKLMSVRNHHDALVVSLPMALTQKQALSQLKKIMEQYDFSGTMGPEIAEPKYRLATSKLQKQTVIDAFDALRAYLRGWPLWKIGNVLELVPERCFEESVLKDAKIKTKSKEKTILGIAASREVKRGFNLAENAARGVFPSDKPATDYFNRQWDLGFTPSGIRPTPKPTKRKAGRPPSSKSVDG